jgi:putative mycofactocin binding protein MftB
VVATALDAFDLTRHWSLSHQVSLRDEEFGALAYHHVNRRLVFLKSRELVELVRRLDDYDTAGSALETLIGENERPRYVTALTSLAASGLLSAG